MRQEKFSQAPVQDSEFSVYKVKSQVVWFNIPMHDASGMDIMKSFEELVQVKFAIQQSQILTQGAERICLHMFKHQTRNCPFPE